MPAERLRGSPEGLVARTPDQKRMKSYGLRSDRTPKGPGYFGEIARSDDPDLFSTELSTSVSIDGKKTLIPLLVPTLSAEEIAHLVDGGQPTLDIVRKAKEHAFQRMDRGLSPFAQLGEQMALPTSAMQQFNEGYESR